MKVLSAIQERGSWSKQNQHHDRRTAQQRESGSGVATCACVYEYESYVGDKGKAPLMSSQDDIIEIEVI